MKLGCVITMHSEHELVLKSIICLRKFYPEIVLIVVHSDDKLETSALSQIKEMANEYLLLSDLSLNISRQAFRLRFGSRAWGRNYSKGFSLLYEKYNVDFTIAFSGDTYVYDASRISQRILEMQSNNYVCYVSKLFGCKLHASTDMPEENIVENRPQDENSTDIIPNFFILDGKFANKTKAFSNIEITNELTFEQCMGDELTRALGNIKKQQVGILSKTAYGYKDGIIEQYLDKK